MTDIVVSDIVNKSPEIPSISEAKDGMDIGDQQSDKDTEPKQMGYLDRGEYTSEKFKIEINNLPKFFGHADLKKKLRTLGLNIVKVKVPHQARHAYVTFRNEEDKEKSFKLLDGWKYKGNKIEVSLTTHGYNQVQKSRKLANKKENRQNNNAEQSQNVEKISDDTRIQNATTPLWNLDYDEQLVKKSEIVLAYLHTLEQKIKLNSN
ncbi:unnamed protein product, partial [Didymodactylos carnosus]